VSPNAIGIIVGLAFILPTIYLIRAKGFDERAWPIFLITLPIYYGLFGLLAMDREVIQLELLYGLPYIAIGLLVWRLKSRLAQIVIAVAWLSHGLYDYYHDVFFINPGVFAWYPAFCALVDIIVGLYLLYDLQNRRSEARANFAHKHDAHHD
jgi:hypothetical protein